ncbi:VOC family protein [Rhizobium sp. AAP43]|uniref:VOC family protein n=1 Tax=Rhizobium sp. AAP43 TaxID=1523420 RepID=UPI0006B95E5F|nr:VOC family protein [Rhizobium sp. AAP43]KPF46915.1 glyoxalase [Rhizobium sp. AAP43]
MRGAFIWHELITPDTSAAKAFYATLLGWEPSPINMGHYTYTTMAVPGFPFGVAGIMGLTDEMKGWGVRPHWTGYIEVDDVDAMAWDFEAEGGVICRPPADIPGVARFAVVADPQGAIVCIMAPDKEDRQSATWPDPGSPGTVGWNELMAGDWAAVWDFYAARFGWEKDMAVDMDAMGIYQTFKCGNQAIGGMMTRQPDMPIPMTHWAYYFVVPAIDAAADKVKALGGQVLMEPHPVPGGAWIAACQDPQGAYFNLTAQSR